MNFDIFEVALAIESPASAIPNAVLLELVGRAVREATAGTLDAALCDRTQPVEGGADIDRALTGALGATSSTAALTILDLLLSKDAPAAADRVGVQRSLDNNADEVEIDSFGGGEEFALMGSSSLPSFQEMDENQDGQLDRIEFETTGAQVSFDELDMNADGFLTEQELDAHGETIVVTGTPFLGIPEFYFGPSYDYYDFEEWMYGGGSGGPDQVAPEDCRDRAALEILADVKADSNHRSLEHGSVTYIGSDGAVHRSPVFEGDETSASGGYSYIDPQAVLDWLQNNNIPLTNVIAWTHNHDAYHYGTSSEEAKSNRYPSTNDWNFAGFLINRGVTASSFALYIIDVDDNLREFSYADRATFQDLTSDQKKRGIELPPEMVSDGSAC